MSDIKSGAKWFWKARAKEIIALGILVRPVGKFNKLIILALICVTENYK